ASRSRKRASGSLRTSCCHRTSNRRVRQGTPRPHTRRGWDETRGRAYRLHKPRTQTAPPGCTRGSAESHPGEAAEVKLDDLGVMHEVAPARRIGVATLVEDVDAVADMLESPCVKLET